MFGSSNQSTEAPSSNESTQTPSSNQSTQTPVENLPPRLIAEWDEHINLVKRDTGNWLTLADQEIFIREWFENNQ